MTEVFAVRNRRHDRRAALIGLLVFLLAGVAAPGRAQDDHGDASAEHHVPLFPTSGNQYKREGFVRVINRGHGGGDVHIRAIDDSGYAADEVTLTIAEDATVHFNSGDLENGGADAVGKGLSGSTGAPVAGDWRLVMTSSLDIEVLAYIRHIDGFLTSMTDTAPSSGRRHRVAVFNPGSNANQVSHLRLINPGQSAAEVDIAGVDDDGASPGNTVEVTVDEGEAVTLPAAVLETGGTDFEGALGNGRGKWQLNISSTEPIMVMSLMESTKTSQLTNLSTAPMTAFETARQTFDSHISAPIVQSKCINCHVEGGQSSHTPLVFENSSADDHQSHNFNEFKDYLADDDGHGHDHDHDHGDRPAAVILDKIQGNQAHGGGQQVAPDSQDFRNMELFLLILEDEIAAGDGGDGGDGGGGVDDPVSS